MTERGDTRFRPGESGNPAGRRPGSGWVGKVRQQLQEAWEGSESDGADGIRSKLVELAKAGDMQAIRLVAERVCPPLRAVEAAVPIELPMGTLGDKADAVLRALGVGELAPGQASQVMQAIAALAKVQEIDDLTRRIEALEKRNAA